MSEASLRYELAGELGKLAWDRQEIVNLVQAHASAVDVADLPQGSARTAWLHVLMELTNRGETGAIERLIEEGRRRSKRVDWRYFETLATRRADSAPIPDQATTLWAHLGMDVRWGGEEEDGRRDVTRVASEPQMIEAQVTLQWAGRRPADPVFEAVVQPLLGRATRAVVSSRPIASNIENVASWRITFPVTPGWFRSRRVVVTATCDHQVRDRVRYLAAQAGYWCTLALWIALAGFLVLWLAPLGASVSATGISLWAVSFGFGWIVPRIKEVWAPWSWVTRLWEATLPTVAVIATLGVVLPVLLLISVVNNTFSEISINESTIGGGGKRKTFMRYIADLAYSKQIECKWSEDPAWPGDAGCSHESNDIRGVSHIEISCRHRDENNRHCTEWKTASLAKLAGLPDDSAGVDAQVPLDWPKGFREIDITSGALVGIRKASSRNEGCSNPPCAAQLIEFLKPPIAPSSTVSLKLVAGSLVTGSQLDIEYSDSNQLHCELPISSPPPRIDLIEVRPPTGKLTLGVEIGGTKSTWNGVGSGTRACLGHGELAALRLDLLPDTSKGLTVRLPTDRGIKRVKINESASASCPHPEALRFVALDRVPPGTFTVKIGDAVVQRLDPRLGFTCAATGNTISLPPPDSIDCTLQADSLNCEPKRVKCWITPDALNTANYGEHQCRQCANPATIPDGITARSAFYAIDVTDWLRRHPRCKEVCECYQN